MPKAENWQDCLPPQRRRLGRRRARSRRGRGDRRAGADAALSLRHGARTRAARVREDRGVRAAQWAHRRQPAEAGAAERGGAQEPARRSGKAARHRGRHHRNAATTGATRSSPSCKPCWRPSAPSPTCHRGTAGCAAPSLEGKAMRRDLDRPSSTLPQTQRPIESLDASGGLPRATGSPPPGTPSDLARRGWAVHRRDRRAKPVAFRLPPRRAEGSPSAQGEGPSPRSKSQIRRVKVSAGRYHTRSGLRPAAPGSRARRYIGRRP